VLADPGFYNYETLKEAACKRPELYFLPYKQFEGSESGSREKCYKDNLQKKDGAMTYPQGKSMQLKTVITYEDGHTVSVYGARGVRSAPSGTSAPRGPAEQSRRAAANHFAR
jgi:hypothetical protein